eukprot:gene23863-9427_t
MLKTYETDGHSVSATDMATVSATAWRPASTTQNKTFLRDASAAKKVESYKTEVLQYQAIQRAQDGGPGPEERGAANSRVRASLRLDCLAETWETYNSKRLHSSESRGPFKWEGHCGNAAAKKWKASIKVIPGYLPEVPAGAKSLCPGGRWLESAWSGD